VTDLLCHTAPVRWRIEHRSFSSFDGTPIAYQIAGNDEGVPLLLANGVGASIEAYRHVIDTFGDRFRFFAWDYRGLFRSGRPIRGYAALRIEDHAHDARALLAHEGIDRFHAFGWSMGVQVLLELARIDHARFESLVLHNGVAGRPYDSVLSLPALAHITPRVMRALQRVDGTVTSLVHFAVDAPGFLPVARKLGLVHRDLDGELFITIARGFKELDLHLYLELLQKMGEHDATDVLRDIGCPALVLASGRDVMTPASRSEEMARLLPHAALEIVPHGTHYAAVEFPDLVNRVLERFWRASFPVLIDGRVAS